MYLWENFRYQIFSENDTKKLISAVFPINFFYIYYSMKLLIKG